MFLVLKLMLLWWYWFPLYCDFQDLIFQFLWTSLVHNFLSKYYIRIHLVFQGQKTIFFNNYSCLVRCAFTCCNKYSPKVQSFVFYNLFVCFLQWFTCLLSTPLLFLTFWCIIVAVALVCVHEIRTTNIYRKITRFFSMALKGAPVNHDIQICHLSRTFIFINIKHFHVWYIVAIPDREVLDYLSVFCWGKLVFFWGRKTWSVWSAWKTQTRTHARTHAEQEKKARRRKKTRFKMLKMCIIFKFSLNPCQTIHYFIISHHL